MSDETTTGEILIEAGDALVEALASGNTGVRQNALDGWEAAKSAALAAVVESVEVDEAVEPGDAPDGEQKDAESGSSPIPYV